MKKFIAVLAVAATCMFAANSAKAIEDQWSKGTFVVGGMVGYYPGFGVTAYGDYVLVDSWWKGHFTVGGQVNLMFKSPINPTDLTAAARATYGLNITDSFEVHAGALTGLGFAPDYVVDHKLGLCYGGITGVRYFFTENFGATAEFNYLIGSIHGFPLDFCPYFNIGVAYKF